MVDSCELTAVPLVDAGRPGFFLAALAARRALGAAAGLRPRFAGVTSFTSSSPSELGSSISTALRLRPLLFSVLFRELLGVRELVLFADFGVFEADCAGVGERDRDGMARLLVSPSIPATGAFSSSLSSIVTTVIPAGTGWLGAISSEV